MNIFSPRKQSNSWANLCSPYVSGKYGGWLVAGWPPAGRGRGGRGEVRVCTLYREMEQLIKLALKCMVAVRTGAPQTTLLLKLYFFQIVCGLRC